jgi:hypothetical protein
MITGDKLRENAKEFAKDHSKESLAEKVLLADSAISHISYVLADKSAVASRQARDNALQSIRLERAGENSVPAKEMAAYQDGLAEAYALAREAIRLAVLGDPQWQEKTWTKK